MFNNIYSGLMLLALSIFMGISNVYAADHVEAPLAVSDPEIDITDVYAFLDPNDESQIVIAMAVNPFLAASNRSTGFGKQLWNQSGAKPSRNCRK